MFGDRFFMPQPIFSPLFPIRKENLFLLYRLEFACWRGIGKKFIDNSADVPWTSSDSSAVKKEARPILSSEI